MVFHAVLQYTYCASDNADINANDENSNGCLNPSFLDIKWHLRLSFQCVASATPRGNMVRNKGLGRCEQRRAFLLS